MAFPASALPIKHEWLINGTWTDITSRVRGADDVRITRGYSSEQSALSASSCVFTLNNHDLFFSSRIPGTTNYGMLGKNIQSRTSITESTTFLKLADYSIATGDYDGASIATADKAVLDIVGDIDIRIDIEPDNWRGGYGQMLVAKWIASGNQRSWIMWIDRRGYLGFAWTTGGTDATRILIMSSVVVPASGRNSLRCTLDVNNGAGGYTQTFYTSDSVTGTWTQLGAQTVTTAGVTSIFSSTSPLTVGIASTQNRTSFNIGPTTPQAIVAPFIGRIYRMQLYQNIAGTLRADMNATAQAAGSTSWSDGLATANTWTLTNSAEITAQDYRFWGEVGFVPPKADSTGTDVYSPATAFDILSRLQIGSKAVKSSIYTNLIRYSDAAAGTSGTMDLYFPCEDGAQATSPTPVIGKKGYATDCTFSTDTAFPGSAGTLVFSTDSAWAAGDGVASAGTTNTGVCSFLFYFKAPSIPASTMNFMFFNLVGGTITRMDIDVGAASYRLRARSSDGTSLLSTTVGFGTGAEPDQWLAMRVMLTQNGGNVDYEWGWYPIGAPVSYGASGSFAATVGRPSGNISWGSPSFTGKTGWNLAHVAAMREVLEWNTYNFVNSTNGYVGEYPSARFKRLCQLYGIPFWVVGRQYDFSGETAAEPDPMGPQTLQPLMALLQECTAIDGGYLYGPRDKFGLAFRLRNSIYNREAVQLNYSQQVLSGDLSPREDLFFAKNDVTVVRPNGGTARFVKTTGTLNTSESSVDPQGIGTYDPGPQTINVQADDQLSDFAGEIVFFGTWDELRYVQVTVQLERQNFVNSATLTRAIRKLDLFDPIAITGLSNTWLPPDDAELLVLGYSEVLQNRGHVFILNTAPYGPYRVNDMTASILSRARIAGSHSALNAGITTTATSFAVKTTSGKLWSTSVTNIKIKVGGELMTVGSISGTSSPQTFNSVTRSVNGVVLAHSANDVVVIAEPWYVIR